MKFVIKPARRLLRRQVRVNAVADNGRTLLWSERYTNLTDAEQMIATVKAEAPSAPIVHQTKEH